MWPGDFLEVDSPPHANLSQDQLPALEPCIDSRTTLWLSPSLVTTVAGKIHIPNHTNQPLAIKRNSHIAQVCPVYVPNTLSPRPDPICVTQPPPSKSTVMITKFPHSSAIKLDLSNTLPADTHSQFIQLHKEFDQVFNPEFPCYNRAAGPVQAVVNMGPTLSPHWKGFLPQYARNRLVELQEKFNSLEKAGVFVKPEEQKVIFEYLNLSFLINKPSGERHLVTAKGQEQKGILLMI